MALLKLHGGPKNDEILHIFWPHPYLFSSHAGTRQNIAILKKLVHHGRLLYTCANFEELWPTNPWDLGVDLQFLGAHSAKVELCARASIRLACFAGTCQILVFTVSINFLGATICAISLVHPTHIVPVVRICGVSLYLSKINDHNDDNDDDDDVVGSIS